MILKINNKLVYFIKKQVTLRSSAILCIVGLHLLGAIFEFIKDLPFSLKLLTAEVHS